MKTLKNCIITLLYTLILLATVLLVTASAAYYRLFYQEKAITISSANLEYKIYHSTLININVDKASIYVDQPTKNLILSGSNISIQHNQKPLFTLDSFQVVAYLASFFKSFDIPLDVSINKPQLLFKNLPIDRSINEKEHFDFYKIINKIHLLLNAASRQSSIFLQNFKISEAFIYYKSSIYELNIDSSLDAQNLFSGYMTIKDQEATSRIDLTIDNKKQYINTQLKFDHFPTEIFANFIPEQYYSRFLDDSIKGSLLTGTAEYSINNLLNNNTLNITLENQSSQKTKENFPSAIEQLNLNIITDNKLHNTFIKDFLLEFSNNTKLQINGHILRLSELFTNSFKINGTVIAQNIQINNLGDLWPEEVASPVRKWLTESMHNGIINNASCELNIKNINHILPKDISANIQFENIDLKYDQDYEQLNKLTGTASFDAHSAKIEITSGEMLTSKITNGNVEIIYDNQDIPLIISASTEGDGKDYLGFIGTENLQLIKSKGLDLQNIQSNLQGTAYIKVPLGHEISLANTTLDINATLKNTSMNFRDDFKLSEGDLSLLIDNKSVHISGETKINNQSATINWISNFDNNDNSNFDHRLDANLTLNPGSSFEQLLNNNAKIINGSAVATIEYISYPQNETVNSTIDLSNANFTIPDVSLEKDINQKCLITLNMRTNENKSWQTTKLDLISEPNINITGYGEFSNDLSSIIVFNADLKSSNNNLSIKYDKTDSNSNLLLTGQKIDLKQSNLLEILGNSQKNQEVKIDIDLKEVEMPNDTLFTNVLASFKCLNGICNKGSLDLKINPESYVKLTLINKNWEFYTNNASSFLKALNIYKDIEGGELTIKLSPVDDNKTKVSNVYNGQIELTNFTAIKTPILAKFLSFSSFRGILSALQNYKSIPFHKMQGNFIVANNIIRINQTYFTGDFLTLSLNGTIDLNKQYINFAGQIVPPVYGVNYILSLVPFVGHELVGSNGKKGLISASYTIKGNFDHTKTSVNAMGIFLPGIITDGLTGFSSFIVP